MKWGAGILNLGQKPTARWGFLHQSIVDDQKWLNLEGFYIPFLTWHRKSQKPREWGGLTNSEIWLEVLYCSLSCPSGNSDNNSGFSVIQKPLFSPGGLCIFKGKLHYIIEGHAEHLLLQYWLFGDCYFYAIAKRECLTKKKKKQALAQLLPDNSEFVAFYRTGVRKLLIWITKGTQGWKGNWDSWLGKCQHSHANVILILLGVLLLKPPVSMLVGFFFFF